MSLRTNLLCACLALLPATLLADPIDRHALVTRHNITVNAPDPYGAMAVGNGDFAFNFDITGTQTFPDYYEKTMPVGILTDWAWHHFPNPENFAFDTFKMKSIPKHDRQFVYPASGTNHPTTQAAYLRGNPNRFGLGRIGLEMTKADGTKADIKDLQQIEQKLDLWTGLVTSSFQFDGQPVKVQTVAHPDRDEVAIRVESPLIASHRLTLKLSFGYATESFGPRYDDFSKPDAHKTTFAPHDQTFGEFTRQVDDVNYFVRTRWSEGMAPVNAAAHEVLFNSNTPSMEFTAWFAPKMPTEKPDAFDAVVAASADHWAKYWQSGGVLDLSGNDDPRAAELERRIVLSQYVMAVHDANIYPPQETGLGVNSWYGKYHMEMYWWHSAHWALWGHPELLEKSLIHLIDMMPPGEKMAKLEGCKGVKWSKMTDPSGDESPSGVGPVLVWQQPHPIHLAELVYRAKPEKATLEKYSRIVFETADYMATFVDYDPVRKEYVLGPGVSSGDEKHTDVEHNMNPTMEIGYWKWAIATAQQWRVRMGLPRDPHWDDVVEHLAKPVVRDGVYTALELPEEKNAAFMPTWLYGVMQDPDVDKEAMRTTLHRSYKAEPPINAVTWGTAMAAMCAARLGEPDYAVNLLAGKYDTNPFRPSGYTVRRPDQTPMYFPANGGWLSAAAMMAAGWDGSTGDAPGFPKNWKVRYEGLLKMP